MRTPAILLLEDEALIAMDVERTLDDAQAGTSTSLASCAAALAWLANYTPDAAIIDIFLRDGECIEVAEILVERGVPFVVHSARRGVERESHQVFLNGTWVPKPSDPARLVKAVNDCLSSKSRHLPPILSDGTEKGHRRA
ncbi:response regulator [Rhizobium esperanzae]|uniref:Response regulator n=1 Tax=Rhizobium esperanzae TaxID=1967781 RepID=A0A246DPT7_9HYPH|nr:response regulator [Rhizobium esperanzae]